MIETPVFLGWERPALHSAVDWLHARHARDGAWDMGHVVVAVPGRRPGRRLLHLLALAAQRAGEPLGPPEIVTVGRLPDVLLDDAPAPAPPAALLFAWVAALRAADKPTLAALFPARADRRSLAGDLATARDLARLHDDLAAGGRRFADVPALLDRSSFDDGPRWSALARLERLFGRAVEAAGLTESATIVSRGIEGAYGWSAREVVLLATPDLAPRTRELLRAAARAGATIVPLVDADEAAMPGVREGFDELGVARPEYWAGARIDLPEGALVVADRPRDQAGAIVRYLARLTGEDGARYTAADVTVGLGDPTLGPAVARALHLSGAPARLATGRAVARSGPATLLAGMAGFLEDGTAERFAALLRHPDLESALPHGAAPLDALDEVRATQLPARIGPVRTPSGHRTDGASSAVEAADGALARLLAPLRGSSRPVVEWARPAAEALAAIYGARDLRRGHPDDEPLVHALGEIGDALRSLAQLPPPLVPPEPASAADALRVVFSLLDGTFVPEPAGEGAVEILGWLELALDDAPVVVVAGLNEGAIPESVHGDPFLPDALRRRLGLTDNAARYARDAARLRAILGSGRRVLLVAGRRGAEGDPLNPSRLLFAAGEAEILARVARFFGGSVADEGASLAVLPRHGTDAFTIPCPVPPAGAPDEIHVTAFAAYLRCPYRFWLERVIGLRDPADDAIELDALAFGTLAHDVLAAFARGPLSGSQDAAAIESALCGELDRFVAVRFGPGRLPVIDLQAARLRRRFARIAAWQARQAAEGWRIRADLAEARARWTMTVDGSPIVVTGRIDRIDERDGAYRVIDYKAGDVARDPEETHRATGPAGPAWTDLQLPLYRRLAGELGVPIERAELGYVCVAADDRAAEPYRAAAWTADELADAEEAAREVVRKIRRGVFWPPAAIDRPDDHDECSGIALDRCLDRARYLAAATASLAREGRP